MSMKRVFLGFGVVLMVLSMMNVVQAYTITNFDPLSAPAGVTISSSGNIVSRNWQGTLGYGVQAGHVDGEIDGFGSGEWILVAFDVPQYINVVQISALYAAGAYSDIVNETAFISYNTDYANRPNPADFHVTVANDGVNYSSMSGAGSVTNVSPGLVNFAGVWNINNLFPGTAVDSLLFYVGPNANNTYSDYSIVSLDTTAVPLPGAVWLLGAGLVGLVGLRRRFVK